ncbi:hypothetical protein ACFUS2_00500 [[Kitasatospora] papulosa]|uniref:hypothetical protein n=1 Tax=[Kitasatospora] papulosa TaxID=1464011 RepID=UPI003636FECF
MEQWLLIEADLHQTYGIDVDQPGLLRERSWRWLRTRIAGLISTDSRLGRHFAPEERDNSRGGSNGAGRR